MRTTRSAERLERWERRTSAPLLLAALLLLVVLLVPLLVTVEGALRDALSAAGTALYLVFVVDYAVRLVLAPDRWGFVRGHPLDLLLVLAPPLRPLRLLALVLLLQRRATRSLQVRVAGSVAVSVGLLLLGAAAAALAAERHAPGANITTYPDALWWAVATASTVGYGDLYPVTAVGRVVAIVVILLGIGLLGVLTASIAASFVDRQREQEQEADEAAAARTAALLEQLTAEVRELRTRLEQQAPR